MFAIWKWQKEALYFSMLFYLAIYSTNVNWMVIICQAFCSQLGDRGKQDQHSACPHRACSSMRQRQVNKQCQQLAKLRVLMRLGLLGWLASFPLNIVLETKTLKIVRVNHSDVNHYFIPSELSCWSIMSAVQWLQCGTTVPPWTDTYNPVGGTCL